MPQALAIAGVAGTIAGTGFSAVSAIQQGDYQAAVAQRNAQIAMANAGNALQAGAQQEQQQLFKTAGVVSAARAAQGSSGLDVNSGSGVNVRASSDALGVLGGAEIRSNAARAAYGDETQSVALTDTANADKVAGENAAFGDVLSGVGKLGGLAGQLYASGALPGQGSPDISGGNIAGAGSPAGWGSTPQNYGWGTAYGTPSGG